LTSSSARYGDTVGSNSTSDAIDVAVTASEAATSSSLTPVADAPATSVPATAAPTATAPDVSTPTATTPVATVPTVTTPVGSEPVTSRLATTVPVTSAPKTTAPVASTPVADAPITPVPVVLTPVTVAPDASAEAAKASAEVLSALMLLLESLIIAPEASRTGYDRDDFKHSSRYPCASDCHDPYTGIEFTPANCDVDHIVAAAEAYESGATQWTVSARRSFGDDSLNLAATRDCVNRSKGDRDLAEW